jgi:tagatose-6-phosphate ketose/aldose isomerase
LDEGFAMTSSYSTMLLTALACFDTMPVSKVQQTMETLANAARDLLTQSLPTHRPERAVFLGAGSLKGAMREAALKVLELTAGQVITSWDSTLGFRHGPKAIIKGDTSAFISLSSDNHSRQYDTDIVTEIKSQFPSINIQTLGSTDTDADISFAGTGIDAWDAVLHVLWSQRLAVAWSKDLDLNVDNPFIDHGNLTRVVAGVTLYTHQFG